MAELRDVVHRVMVDYTGEALNGHIYLTSSADQQLLTTVFIGESRGKRLVNTGLVVRLVDDLVIIEHDINDKILMDALIQNGVPRSQIILAYIGETVETDASLA